MPRVKRGPKRAQSRKKVLKAAKGFFGARSKAHRVAMEAVDRANQFAYRDRRQRKRQFRSLWIVRINAACRLHGLSYNRLIDGLNKAGVEIDRKMLADLAVHDAEAFGRIAVTAREALEAAYGKAPGGDAPAAAGA